MRPYANAMGHIELSRDRDLIVVAPASADFIAKLAGGLADDLLSTLCLARECPLLVAPAMNRQMWENAATQRNIEQLAEDGVRILGPASGDQACGEVGMGRMLEPRRSIARSWQPLQPTLLAGVRVLITAGSDVRADRRGARHHQPQLGAHGLCRGTGGAGGRRAGDAGVGSHRAAPPAQSAPGTGGDRPRTCSRR